ncbi:MAG: asparagine synthase (glutamine-hydrolyzing) [bacterium]
MCGIAGIWDFKEKLGIDVLNRMKESLHHRGPDDSGIYLDKQNNLGLAHTRLSIIELSEKGHQPMIDKELNLVIVFNGEIYNYLEIKKELKCLGYKFFSNSDTEVILKSYKEWGTHCLEKFRGMFSFCIFDIEKQELFLARDRLGIKPLYYFNDGNKFIFGSEINTIKASGLAKEINSDSIGLFLFLGYIPSPSTFYKNIVSLEPGFFLKISKNNKLEKIQYYNLKKIFLNGENSESSFTEAIKKTKDTLLESLKYHLVSDVEVGVFLSGGIDSSALVSLMRQAGFQKIKTVSIIFPDNVLYDESKYAKVVAKKFNTEHIEVEVTSKDITNHLNDIFSCMGQPTTDGINTYFVSAAAKKAGLKTVLSGLGGDEIFGGYPSFKNIPIICKYLKLLNIVPPNLWTNFLPAKQKGKINFIATNNNMRFSDIYSVYRGIFTPKEIQQILNPDLNTNVLEHSHFDDISFYTKDDYFKNISFLETNCYMAGQLLRDADVFSMAHPLEIRVPFVDHIVIENIAKIPSIYKTCKKRESPKDLLIKSIGDLPKEITSRHKMGFIFPFEYWLHTELKQLVYDSLLETTIFKREAIENALYLFSRKEIQWSKIWALFVLNKFLS